MLWGGVGLAFVFVLCRLYIRLAVFRRLFADDALVCAAWLMTLANAVIWQHASGDMYLTLLISSGVSHVIPPDFLARMGVFLHALFASYLLFISTLWSIKLSFLVFFRKLGWHLRFQNILWWSVLVFTVVSYFASVALINFKCMLAREKVRMGEAPLVYQPFSNVGDVVANTQGTCPFFPDRCSSRSTGNFQYFSFRFATALDVVTDVFSKR